MFESIKRNRRKEKKWLKLFCVVLLAGAMSGCLITRVVTVPMRLVGAIVSIVPGPGDVAHDAIDAAAEAVDDFIPF